METRSGASCRICKSGTGNDLMKSPCMCKGTLGYVHFTCLENWLNQASRNYCELCRYRFDATQSRRYSMCQSLWVWVSHRSNRIYLCYDLLITLVLTALTLSIVFICLVGAGVIIREESTAGLQDPFVRTVLILFLLILLGSYFTTLYLIVQDHVKPWYRWWRNCTNVRLQIDLNKLALRRSHVDKNPAANATSVPAVETLSTELLSFTHSESTINIDKGVTGTLPKTKSEIKIQNTPSGRKIVPNTLVSNVALD